MPDVVFLRLAVREQLGSVMNELISGVLLCGGKSCRMGRNKALLPCGRMTLVEHMLALLESIRAPFALDQVLLSGSVEGYPALADLLPDKGPLGGIYTVMDGQRPASGIQGLAKWLLAVPVDMPRLTVPLLERLLIARSEPCKVVFFREHELPLLVRVEEDVCGLLKRRVFSANWGRDLSLRSFVEELRGHDPALVRELDVCSAERTAFLNINRPQDWNEYCQENWCV